VKKNNIIKRCFGIWQNLMRKCYDYAVDVARRDGALKVLAAVSFVESSFFPIPPDIFLIPIVTVKSDRYLKIAACCTVCSVLGGVFGYAIGMFLFDMVAQPILDFYNYTEAFNRFRSYYVEYGVWIVFGAGLTPFPYKVVTIASGVMALNFPVFLVASIVSRGARFFLVAFLVAKFGDKARVFIEKHLGWLSILFFVLLFASFLLIKVL